MKIVFHTPGGGPSLPEVFERLIEIGNHEGNSY
jgi:hypothetical protein